jgi:hypothetical protein
MAAAGFRSLFLGLEATDPARLREIRKGFTSLDKVEAGVGWFRSRGVDASASLIVGLPGQTLTDVARDSLNLVRRGVRFWTNPFYPVPGSPDFQRCNELGLIDDDTECALFDQFNFAFGSDELSPEELYWAWVSTQALAQWPEYALEGSERRRAGERLGHAAAAERLLEDSAGLMGSDRGLEVPAVPVALEGERVVMHPDGCFCSLHGLADGGAPASLCTFSGDVVAAAVALYCAEPAACEQVATAAGGEGCAFRLGAADAPLVRAVQAEFVRELDTRRCG